MNTDIIKSKLRENREYKSLLSALDSVSFSKIRPFSVTGLSEGAKPAFYSALCDDYIKGKDESVLLIFPEEKEASVMADYLTSCGLPAYYFPARDYNFNNVKASRDFEHERLEVLNRLAGGIPSVIVTAPEAALQLTMSRDDFVSSSIWVKSMDTIDLENFLHRLTLSGYIRSESVEGVGQFAVRGGIIDVYPPIGDPLRIELFDCEIDRMGNFDVMTQRFFGENLYEAVIPPVREIIASEDKRRELQVMLDSHIKILARSEAGAGSSLTAAAGESAILESGAQLDSYDKYLPLILPEQSCMLDYFDGLLVLSDSAKLEERARAALEITENTVWELREHKEIPDLGSAGVYMRSWDDVIDLTTVLPCIISDSFMRSDDSVRVAASFNMNSRHIPSYSGNMQLLREDLSGFLDSNTAVTILVSGEPEVKAIIKELQEDGISAVSEGQISEEFFDLERPPVLVMHGGYAAGFELASPKFALLDFSGGRSRTGALSKRTSAKKSKKSKTETILSYADLSVGDIVVHSVYGIGQFMGIETMTVAGVTRDYVNIKYAGTDKLFLPVDQLDLVSKYIGAGSQTGDVKLSKMGGADWNRAKSKARSSAKDMARELIDLYARRQRSAGISFDQDDAMSRQFADAFEYEETDGQLAAISEIRRDMEATWPMDRLLCGDVGYGKTEVAMRAAFKAVNSGYQVAILVPTTILAYQHYQTAVSRFRGFPVSVDMLSRFRTPTQQAATLRKVRRGDVDIIIGTHRLLSKDVEFAKLGLIIIDEEQRFGVAQKEKLKQISANCDVLTLTATPIPRTLNMAMSGILDMSVLEEAPGSRHPVQTYVMEHDAAIITEAIRREIRRGGQVFYLNNNIDAVYSIAARLSREIPDVRVSAAHGRMDREQLEDIWTDLVRGEIDILVSTTIIETGIDVPNANTLIIERADKYGLSQLHQIRGRVGRSSRRAYAYFTYPPMRALPEIAVKRLEAIKEYAEFGAGFKIALRDLEIRGAGNLLGSEQHGHLDAVGYDMYIRLLNEAVLEEKGETVKALAECSVTVDCDAYLSSKYIPSSLHRMEMYKKIAHISERVDYIDVIDELCDRFSSPPAAAVNLCKISYVRALGIKAGFTKVEYREGFLSLFSEKVNVPAITSLSAALPQLNLKMSLAGVPHAVCRLKKSANLLDDITAILTKYIAFLN